MNLAKTKRPRFSRFTFVFLGLGICVFTWGLQYKLSLYYPAHSSYHQVPEAKLLSRNEQPSMTANLPMVRPEELPGSGETRFTAAILAWFAALALCLFPEPGFSRSLKKHSKPWLCAAQASLNAFFFRPPPISA